MRRSRVRSGDRSATAPATFANTAGIPPAIRAPFVCEHVLPRVLGAGSTAEELALACPACNGHKYDKTGSLAGDRSLC